MYRTLDWTAWDAQVRAWFDAVGPAEAFAPPASDGRVVLCDRGVWAIRGAFGAVTNAVPPTLVGAVPTWPVWAWERERPEGRVFGTVVGRSVCRVAPVPEGFVICQMKSAPKGG